MKVVAYLRRSPACAPLSAQYADLERAARHRGWTIVWCVLDPGDRRAGDLRTNRHFLALVETILGAQGTSPLDGAMFWHIGHVAGSLETFVRLIGSLSGRGLSWHVHQPRMDSAEDRSKALVAMSERLLEIHDAINGHTTANRSLSMKARGTSPGRQKIPRETERTIVRMKKSAYPIADIAKKTGVSPSAIKRVIRENDL